MRIAGFKNKRDTSVEGADKQVLKQCIECGMMVVPHPVPEEIPPVKIETGVAE
jgi:hypothetical protein